MKAIFEEPVCEVIHLENSTIVTSGCYCNIGGYDFGPGSSDDHTCTGADTACTCDPDQSVNCW